jgi:hypothetical protein
VDEFGLSVIDAAGSITDQQRVFREMVSRVMAGEESEVVTKKGKD